MIKKSRGTRCPPWCEDRDVAGERDHEVHFTDLGSVAGTHPDPPGSTATVVVALVQDAQGELATQVSLLGDYPTLALLDPEAAGKLAQLLLEASGLGRRREQSDQPDEQDGAHITVLPPDRDVRSALDQGC